MKNEKSRNGISLQGRGWKLYFYIRNIQGGPEKSKPLPIESSTRTYKACQWDYFFVKLKSQSRTSMLSLGFKYTMRDV